MARARGKAETVHTASGKAFTDLVLTVFRLNSTLIAAGDRMTRDLRLTSARWQIFGALADEPLTASQVARNMGLHRQTVQPLVDALAADGLVELIDNPNHRRARLIRMTAAGKAAYDEALLRQVAWANATSNRLPAKKLAEAEALLREITRRMEEA
jgi:DNA-binding MarR family transcriptional regulator